MKYIKGIVFLLYRKVLRTSLYNKKCSARMRTRAYREDVAIATVLGARVRMRTLGSLINVCILVTAAATAAASATATISESTATAAKM